jgi:hypothetical protein
VEISITIINDTQKVQTHKHYSAISFLNPEMNVICIHFCMFSLHLDVDSILAEYPDLKHKMIHKLCDKLVLYFALAYL